METAFEEGERVAARVEASVQAMGPDVWGEIQRMKALVEGSEA
jgi:hypothetical protein